MSERDGPDANDPRGSHCGAGAPRLDIAMQDGSFYFLGCNSPAAQATDGDAFLRLRWAPVSAYNASTGQLEDISNKTVQSIEIVMDEGADTGPDNFGVAILDNIDVNGTLVGQGPEGH